MTHLALHSRRVLYFRYTVQCTVRTVVHAPLDGSHTVRYMYIVLAYALRHGEYRSRG